MTRIKICGITNLEDAWGCAEAGADALGFVFASGSRQTSPEVAQKISEKLRDMVSKVGVFVNENLETLHRIARTCDLDCVQLHGDEDENYLKRVKVRFIKVFPVRDESVLSLVQKFKLKLFMLDTYQDGKTGGTGKSFDWDIAVKAKQFGRVYLSGGLTPENVASALEKVRPYGVDVCSGVEKFAGRKDLQKVKTFIQKVRTWDTRIS